MAPAAVLLGLALGTVGSLIVELVGGAGGSPVAHPTPAVSIIADIVFDLACRLGLRGRCRDYVKQSDRSRSCAAAVAFHRCPRL